MSKAPYVAAFLAFTMDVGSRLVSEEVQKYSSSFRSLRERSDRYKNRPSATNPRDPVYEFPKSLPYAPARPGLWQRRCSPLLWPI